MTVKIKAYLKTTIILVLALHSTDDWAASPDAGQLLNEQQRLQPRSQPKPNEPELIEPELQFDKNNAANTIKIKAIRFQGAEKLSTDSQLQQWVANAIGKTLSFGQLQQLAAHVTQELRNAGYLLAKAYLPKQDITEGIIQVNIVQGQIDIKDGLKINGKALRIDELQLRDILDQGIRPGKALIKQDLERSLLLINDLPGLNAQASVGSGTAPETSKVTVNANEGSLLGASLWADNFGNHYTGTWRGNGMVNINDPFKIGDQLRLTMTGSQGLLLGSTRYAVPLTANGLKMEVHVSHLQYQIGRELASAQLEGEATSVGTSLNYPFIRSRAFSLWGNAGYEHRALRDKALASVISDRQLNEAVVGLNANSFDNWLGGGINNAYLGMVVGNLDRSDDAQNLADDLQGAKTQGSFAKFTYNLARLQRLTDQLSLYATINGQQASGNLDSSEKFILGGPSGIRAYPIGEASGDHGWVINTELRWDVPYALPVGKLQLVGFIDTGHVTLHDRVFPGAVTNLTGKNNYQLSGGGISLNFIQANRYQISGTWAAPIGNNPGRDRNGNNADAQQDTNRFWLQGMVWF
jgi:hemolysin activation/secretion protein